MEDYSQEYTEHNLPLVLLSGLGEHGSQEGGIAPSHRQESGTKLVMQSAECEGDRASALLEQLLFQDGSKEPWNARALAGPTGSMKYAMKPIGRVGRHLLLIMCTSAS